MQTFLSLVANDLRQKTKGDMSRTVVVFPNKRASLFFNEYLLPAEANTQADAIVWAPRYMTINELFAQLSPLHVADKIEVVCRLYRLYKKHTGKDETLDFFYGWGERLLSDFDDIDKNMALPRDVLTNLSDLKALDSNDFLSEEDRRTLSQFFRDFSENHDTEIKTRFSSLWNKLFDIYTDLNKELQAEGLAYEGALYRQVAEQLKRGNVSLPNDVGRYVFVGFNVLDKVEQTLFAELKKRDLARFYWDYDVFYFNDKAYEAGTFLRENIKQFGNELNDECYHNFTTNKTLEFAAAPTENIQARFAGPWLEKHLTKDERNTAVVLCNEDLLQPLLHSLPEELQGVNITKGYPLTHTKAYLLLENKMKSGPVAGNAAWLDSLMHSVEVRAKAVSKKSLPGEMEEVDAASIFVESTQEETQDEKERAQEEVRRKKEAAASIIENDDLHRTLETEACFLIHTTLQRLKRLVDAKLLDVEASTLSKLLKQLLRQLSVPFHGEPASGLQIMGVLETRCLDFENILLLSVNEGNLPAPPKQDSFIPYLLRKAYGLTTIDRQIAVYAYYFFRLLQRAHHVTLAFNTSVNESRSNEMSRFMYQLLVDGRIAVKHLSLTSEQAVEAVQPEPVAKPDNLPDLLKSLSPSALTCYIGCQLQFFFKYVARLKATETQTELIPKNILGSVFHRAAELFYGQVQDKRTHVVSANVLKTYIKGKQQVLETIVSKAIEDVEESEGKNFPKEAKESQLLGYTVLQYLKRLISYESKQGDFTLLETEHKHYAAFPTQWGNETAELKIGGVIDRVDVFTNATTGKKTLRICDYKTGSAKDGKKQIAKNVADLFSSKSDKHEMFQTFLYALVLSKTLPTDEIAEENKALPLMPTLFFVQQAGKDDFSPALTFKDGKNAAPITINDVNDYLNDFEEGLHALIDEIFDPTVPFTPTSDEKEHCKYCDFKALCDKRGTDKN